MVQRREESNPKAQKAKWDKCLLRQQRHCLQSVTNPGYSCLLKHVIVNGAVRLVDYLNFVCSKTSQPSISLTPFTLCLKILEFNIN